MRWVQWFTAGGVARLAGMPHNWSTQRLAKGQEEAFRQAVEQLQRERGGGRVRGEDIRKLLARQFGVAYSLSGVYDLIETLGHGMDFSPRRQSVRRSGGTGRIQKKTSPTRCWPRCPLVLRLSR